MNDFSTKTCLFIGRFQPFHTGHLMVIQGMAQACGRVKIAIGSSEKRDTKENPFNLDERKEMIQRALQAKDLIPRYDIAMYPVPDVPNDSEWVEHMKAIVGDFDAVWSGNKDVCKLCEEQGIEIKEIKEVPGISAHGIREMIENDDGFWTEKVPEEVAQYVKSIDGRERIRNLK